MCDAPKRHKPGPSPIGRPPLVCTIPPHVMMKHSGLETLDLLCFFVATNVSNRILELEALAGCGKTQVIADLIKRLTAEQEGDRGILLLSFTRAAVKVARMRLKGDAGGQPPVVHSQTFDSLFYHAVRSCAGGTNDDDDDVADFQAYRDMCIEMPIEEFSRFECNAKARYALREIRYIIIDEAQDTPPEGLALVRRFRGLGKTVLAAGDRMQAIFGFMRTSCLFDDMLENEKLSIRLARTYRMCPAMVEFINHRWGVGMTSHVPWKASPSSIRTVAVQARTNASLARIYVQMLFAVDGVHTPFVAEGDSEDRFEATVLHEVQRKYRCDAARAQEILQHRDGVLRKGGAGAANRAVFIYSTGHHYKGGEADLTVIGPGLDLLVRGDDAQEEHLKYVASSRPRWGLVDLGSLAYYGHPDARSLGQTVLSRSGRSQGVNSVRQLVYSWPCLLSMIMSTELSPLLRTAHRWVPPVAPAAPATPRRTTSSSSVGSAAVGILWSWEMEQRARRESHAEVHIQTALGPSPRADAGKGLRALRRDCPEIAADDEDWVRGVVGRRIRLLRLRAALARFLVVHAGWPVTSRLAVAGAVAHTRLVWYVTCGFRVPVLFEESPCAAAAAAKVYARAVLGQPRAAAGILDRPSEWRAVILNPSVAPRGVQLKGNADALIVDAGGRTHQVSVCQCRSIKYHQVLQVLLDAVVLCVNARVRPVGALLCNLLRNEVHEFPLTDAPEEVLAPASLAALNRAASCRSVSDYYDNRVSPEQWRAWSSMR